MSIGILLNHHKSLSKDVMLLKGSNQYISITGGWTDAGSPYSGYAASGTETIDSNGITLNITANTAGRAMVTKNTIDITPYTKMVFTVTSASANATVKGVFLNNTRTYFYANNKGGRNVASSGAGVYVVDISGLSGSYYVGVVALNNQGTTPKAQVTISEIYLGNFTDDDFQEVTYIESTGTQHIDTGFTPNNNTRVVCDIMWTQFNNSYWGGFGAGASSTSRTFECYVYSSYVNWNFYNHSYGADSSLGYRGSTNTRYHIDANKNVFTIYNSSGTQLKQITAQDGTFTAPYTMYLFGSHRASSGHGYVRFYGHVYIYDNGTLVREFVPCYRKSDNVIGMWDKVNKQFYTNGGSGTFTKGGDVT